MTVDEYFAIALTEAGLTVVPEEVLVDRLKEMAERHWDDHDREIFDEDEEDDL